MNTPALGVEISGSDLLGALSRLDSKLDAGFARIDAKLDQKADKVDLARMDVKLDSKADKADLARMEARLEQHGKEIGALKDTQRADEVASAALANSRSQTIEWRKWAVGVAAVVVASMPGLLALLHV